LKLFWRCFCVLLPILYGMFIWWQSNTFDPESVSRFTFLLGPTIVKIIGAGFEAAHLIEFGVLYLLIIVALLSFGGISKVEETLTFIIAALYGLLDELHQYYVPFRSTSLIDLTKDIIGILFVWYMIHRFYYKEDSKIGLWFKKISLLAQETNKDMSV
jgi:polysaccharide biosynthesis protein VpsQ